MITIIIIIVTSVIPTRSKNHKVFLFQLMHTINTHSRKRGGTGTKIRH